jgi:hypothetical protein
VLNGFAALFVVLAVWISALGLRAPAHAFPLAQLAIYNLAFLGLGMLTAFHTAQVVVLTDEAITVTQWGRARTWRRDQIAGYCMGRTPARSGGSSYYVIVPKGRWSGVHLHPFLKKDAYFYSWIKSLPRLDTK